MIRFARAILLAVLVRVTLGVVTALASYTALSSALPHRIAPPSLQETIAAIRTALVEVERALRGAGRP